MKKRATLAIGFFTLLTGFVSLTAFTKDEASVKTNHLVSKKQMTAVLEPETLRIHSVPEIGDGGTACKGIPYRVYASGNTGPVTWYVGGGTITQVVSSTEVIVVFDNSLTENGSGWIDAVGLDTDGNPDFFEWAFTEGFGCDTP